MSNDYKAIMAKKKDYELVRVMKIGNTEYEQDAIEAAEAEIKTRGIDPDNVQEPITDYSKEVAFMLESQENQVSRILRCLHFILDTFAVIVLYFINILMTSIFIVSDDPLFITIFSYIILAISFFGYYIFMEYKFGRTLAKALTRTHVVMKTGEKPELRDIVSRTFCRLIPFDRISYLFTKNGFHDYLSDTRVVKDKEEII